MEIEFKNIETLEAFKPIIQEIEQSKLKAIEDTKKLKRGLFLLKHGHYWEGI